MKFSCLNVSAAAWAAACLIWAGSGAAFAGTLQAVVAPPTDQPRSGRPLVLKILVFNPSQQAERAVLPNRVICWLQSDGDRLQVSAAAIRPRTDESVEIGPGQFLATDYSLTIPAAVHGRVALRVPAYENATATFEVLEAGKAHLRSFDEIASLYQPYIGNAGPYEPTYFLVGTEPENSSFQLSFKYRLFSSEGPLVKSFPWADGFHFAYTQTSFWDLKSASKPFADTSYKPEFFFLSPGIGTGWDALKGFFLQTGLRHESNGRGGADSRSTNTVYLKPLFVFYRESSMLGLLVAPKLWLYVGNDDDTNPDLDDYRGYFDLEIKAGKADGLVLRSVLGWAKEGGSVQLDLTYPLHRFLFGNIDLYFQVQYVNALAESLLDYQQRTRALRLGFAIIR